MNGDIEFYPSFKLTYDEKYVRQKNNILFFLNYKGSFGTISDLVIETYRSSVCGKLRVPAFMDVKECIDLQVSPELNLSVRSSEQGLVNNSLLKPITPRYYYGDSITDILKKKLNAKDVDLFFDTEKGLFNVYYDKKSIRIFFYEFCSYSNLVYIDSIKAPLITIGYDEEDIMLADDKKLKSLETYFVKTEKYENAAKVLRRLKNLNLSRISNDKY